MENDRPKFAVPDVEELLLSSVSIGQCYQIRVMQPVCLVDRSEKFPVLYLTDGNEFFDAVVGIAHGLQAAGIVERFLVVGIGYPGKGPYAGEILRGRDLTPENRPANPDYPQHSDVDGVERIPPGAPNWNGATKFRGFLINELIPEIDNRFATIPGSRAFFGHSLGGGFGVDTFCHQPTLFDRLIISSPSLAWDGHRYGIETLSNWVNSKPEADLKIYISVGESEEFDAAGARAAFCSSFYQAVSLLRAADIKGLALLHQVFSEESHATVWPLAVSRGLRYIFGPPPGSPFAVSPAVESHSLEGVGRASLRSGQ